MQTIGLIGGMSWESSAAYYEGLNKGAQQRLGGLHSAKVVLVSVDFAELTQLQEMERWDDIATLLVEAAQGAERGGADFILMCTTAFHFVYDQVVAAVGIPVLHLADVLADACKAAGVTTVGFIGTAFAMQNDFFAQRLSERGLDVNMPDELHVDTVDSIVYDELVFRKVNPSSRRRIVGIIDELSDAGAQGVILGASELSLLVRPEDLEIPIFDVITTHVSAALERALA